MKTFTIAGAFASKAVSIATPMTDRRGVLEWAIATALDKGFTNDADVLRALLLEMPSQQLMTNVEISEMTNPNPIPPAQRVRKSEALLRARGGRRLPGSFLHPETVKALDALLRDDYARSTTAAIERALLEAAQRRFFVIKL